MGSMIPGVYRNNSTFGEDVECDDLGGSAARMAARKLEQLCPPIDI